MCFLFWLDKLYNNFLEILNNFHMKNILFNLHRIFCYVNLHVNHHATYKNTEIYIDLLIVLFYN